MCTYICYIFGSLLTLSLIMEFVCVLVNRLYTNFKLMYTCVQAGTSFRSERKVVYYYNTAFHAVVV